MNKIPVFSFCCISLFCLFGLYFFYFELDSKQEVVDYSKYREMYAKDISQWEKPDIDDGVVFTEMSPLPKIAPDSKENPYTNEKKILGSMLFNERILSKSGQFACASCHNPELGMGDGIKTSFGHDRQRGNRNSPNIMMSGFFSELFWDGRASSLESQILQPITNPIEMAHNFDDLTKNLKNIPEYYPFFILAFGSDEYKLLLKNNYPQLFIKNASTNSKQKNNNQIDFNRMPPRELVAMRQKARDIFTLNLQNENTSELDKYASELITIENISAAIATYERTLVPKNTRFNRFLKGNYNALTDKELYGLHIFRTKGRCMNCHYGVALSDGKFHNIGLSFYGRKLQDLGRYEISGDVKDVGAFKTPSLIAVSKTAPYMHNGIFPTLRGILNMYNAGFPTSSKRVSQDDPLKPQTTELIKPLNLTTEEIEALELFLKTL